MIKTIICGCGVETDDFYGYPDDALYCKTCYAKMQISYFEQMLHIQKQSLKNIQQTISEYEHEIKKYKGWVQDMNTSLPVCTDICADPELMIDPDQRMKQLLAIRRCDKREKYTCRFAKGD